MTAAAEPISDEPERTVISRCARILLVVASAAGAASNFGILALSPSVLGVAGNLEFLVFWSILFGIFGVQSGLQNEATRAATNPSPRGARVMTAGAVWGALFAAAVGLSGIWWGPHLLPDAYWYAVPVLAVTAFLYPLYITQVATLGGSRRWEWYSSELLVESALRVLLVAAAALLGWGLGGFIVGSAAAVATVGVILAVGRTPRRLVGRRADVGLRTLLGHGALAMTSTAFTALLVTGYSVLVKVTNPLDSLGLPPHDAAALMGACMLAVSLTRAPIMMPLTAFVSVVISAFTGHRGTVSEAVRKPFVLLAIVGLAGAAAAWPIGPWVLRMLNPEYVLPGWYFAALTASSVLLAWLTILGALALATNHHVLYVVGWGTASVVAIACLLAPLSLTVSTSLSIFAGPGAGTLVLFLGLSRRSDPSAGAEEDERTSPV